MSNNLTKVFVAAAAAFAAGVALGILFAPDKGSETRRKVKKAMDDITDDFGESLEEKLVILRDIFMKESPKDPPGTAETESGKQSL
jgi:gas vesicle protein